MNRALIWVTKGLEFSGIVLLVIIGLPVLAITALILRGFFLIAAILGTVTAFFYFAMHHHHRG